MFFVEGGKPENPEKNPRSKDENQNKLNRPMTSSPGIEPGPHWWEASALTIVLALLPQWDVAWVKDARKAEERGKYGARAPFLALVTEAKWNLNFTFHCTKFKH